MVARFLVLLVAVSVVTAADFLNCQWVSSLDCPNYNPGVVCATNGQDYQNSCFLAKAQCQDRTLHLKFVGTCASHNYQGEATTATVPTTISGGSGSVTTAQPAPGSTREPVFTNHNQLLDFFCLELMHKACPTDTEMVCGTDNVTYANTCEYEKARCAHRALAVKKFGMC